MMQRFFYYCVLVIRFFFDDFVYFFYNKVQKNRYGLIKFNFYDYIVFLDFVDLVFEFGFLKVQIWKEMDKVNKR